MPYKLGDSTSETICVRIVCHGGVTRRKVIAFVINSTNNDAQTSTVIAATENTKREPVNLKKPSNPLSPSTSACESRIHTATPTSAGI